jgi:hypothetical protein
VKNWNGFFGNLFFFGIEVSTILIHRKKKGKQEELNAFIKNKKQKTLHIYFKK